MKVCKLTNYNVRDFRMDPAIREYDVVDTDDVTDMHGMFHWAIAFDEELRFTDTSKVTDMHNMFNQAKVFNHPVNFDTSNVRNMNRMFYQADEFNQPVNFDTGSVTDMSNMFCLASKFNQPVNFDTRNVEDMSEMFLSAFEFNQPINFDTSSVTNMRRMFDKAFSLYIGHIYKFIANALYRYGTDPKALNTRYDFTPNRRFNAYIDNMKKLCRVKRLGHLKNLAMDGFIIDI